MCCSFTARRNSARTRDNSSSLARSFSRIVESTAGSVLFAVNRGKFLEVLVGCQVPPGAPYAHVVKVQDTSTDYQNV